MRGDEGGGAISGFEVGREGGGGVVRGGVMSMRMMRGNCEG